MVLAREERKAADYFPILKKPCDDRNPLFFTDTDGRGRIVLGPIHLYQFPIFELLYRGKIILEQRATWRFDRKFEYVGVCFPCDLPDLRVMRDALVTHHFEERIRRRDADAADVVLR